MRHGKHQLHGMRSGQCAVEIFLNRHRHLQLFFRYVDLGANRRAERLIRSIADVIDPPDDRAKKGFHLGLFFRRLHEKRGAAGDGNGRIGGSGTAFGGIVAIGG